MKLSPTHLGFSVYATRCPSSTNSSSSSFPSSSPPSSSSSRSYWFTMFSSSGCPRFPVSPLLASSTASLSSTAKPPWSFSSRRTLTLACPSMAVTVLRCLPATGHTRFPVVHNSLLLWNRVRQQLLGIHQKAGESFQESRLLKTYI